MAARASVDDDFSSAGLANALERARLVRDTIPPIVAHLVSADSGALFGEEVVARTAAMLASLAHQISDTDDRLIERLAATAPIAGHCHSLAFEWVVTRRLEARIGLDPVLSPWLAGRIAEERTAMPIAAQARYAREQRRMNMLPRDLPAAIFAQVLKTGKKAGHDTAGLRVAYEEAMVREAVLGRFVTTQDDESPLFDLEQAGVAMFCTALSQAVGCSREDAVVLLDAGQAVRLAIALRAAGVSPERVSAVLMALHGHVPALPPLPDRDEARAMMEAKE